MLFLCRGFISFFSRLFIVLWSLAILRPFFIFLPVSATVIVVPRRPVIVSRTVVTWTLLLVADVRDGFHLPVVDGFHSLVASDCHSPVAVGLLFLLLPVVVGCFSSFSCYGFHLHLLLCPLFGGGHGQNGSDFPALRGQPVSWVLVYVLLPINYPV